MQSGSVIFALALASGCTTEAPPTYDTHETYDAKVEQWGKDRSEWLHKRRARYDAWREGILNAALESVSADQWDEHEISADIECGEKPAEGADDQAYRQCREALLDSLLADKYDGYETLAEYIERRGGEEPEPPYPKYRLEPSPPTEHEMAYEKAKQECDDAGGQWIAASHGDAKDYYVNSMRCLEEHPPAQDPRWEDQLLPYYITVTYDNRSHQVIKFTRTLPESP